MSRITVLAEACGKLQEFENLVNHKNQNYASKRIPKVIAELGDLRYTNAMCGEHAISDWYLRILRQYAENKNNK